MVARGDFVQSRVLRWRSSGDIEKEEEMDPPTYDSVNLVQQERTGDICLGNNQ